MDDLRAKIKRIRLDNTNIERRHFIPEATLFEAMPKSTIETSLKSLTVRRHELLDLSDSILAGARKCFAILILISCEEAISDFFRRDSLQQSWPDDRLPYSSKALQQIFAEDEKGLRVTDFLEKQWEVTIPIMHKNMIFRKLDTEVILPFLRTHKAGKGSMGTAWEIELHPQCHRLSLADHKVIKKTITCGEDDDMNVFEKEVANLALLAHLKHPNIIQLYCSYVYRQEYNLIFAAADGGTLETLLRGKNDIKGPEGSQLLLALADLASAINVMHDFTSEALDLTLSGCHHDLAPRNILIQGENLLLADFGLSTFHNAEEDSLTTFKEVRGSYIAPECQTLHGNSVRTEKIGRASDIWSFGCILAEILIYMVQGAKGVDQFREERKVEVTPEIEWFRFHQGPNRPNPTVDRWLTQLQDSKEPFCRRMVGLIRQMLSMSPDQRPRSSQVLAVLRGISVVCIAAPLLQNLNSACDTYDGDGHEDREFDFAAIVKALKETQHIVKNIRTAAKGDAHRQKPLLRYQYERMMEGLPQHYRFVAKEHLKNLVLSKKDDAAEGLLAAMGHESEKDIGVLLAVRHLTTLAETGRLTDRSHLVLDQKRITIKTPVDIHSLATLDHTSELVLVEWLRYKEEWAEETTRRELLRRLTSVASLFSAESSAQIPGSLKCQGIFHDPSYRAFGFVYGFPSPNTKPITLYSILSSENDRPLLERRFRLAFDICHCIYTFHIVGWLHRNLHPMNVLFFVPDGEDDAEWAKEPRILGFAGSRENELASFSSGPDESGQFRNYHHPGYLTYEERYREEFDYYSVGMLLLEIGLWNTLSMLTDSDRFQGLSDDEYRTEVLNRRVSQLGVAMGTHYMQATRACLLGDISGDVGKGGRAWHTWFKDMVMDRIPLMD
ncbi:kinase domain-containing protein [Nemania abortiva]|nr:kinase domain-containing protein [Nemania abortiva]